MKSRVTIAELLKAVIGLVRLRPISLMIPRIQRGFPSTSSRVGVATIASVSTPRLISSESVLPPEFRIALTSLYQSLTLTPLMDRTSSPTCKPAAAAPEFGDT